MKELKRTKASMEEIISEKERRRRRRRRKTRRKNSNMCFIARAFCTHFCLLIKLHASISSSYSPSSSLPSLVLVHLLIPKNQRQPSPARHHLPIRPALSLRRRRENFMCVFIPSFPTQNIQRPRP